MQVFHTILAELPEKNSIVTHRVTQQYMHNILTELRKLYTE